MISVGLVTAPDSRLCREAPSVSGASQDEVPPPTAEGANSWALVQAAQLGNVAAFGQLYERYAGDVYRYVAARSLDRGLAEDFTSETFLRAFRAITSVTYRGRAFRAWLITIARHIVLDFAKSSYRRCEVSTDTFAEVACFGSMEQDVIDKARGATLRRCVEKLPPAQRTCVRLRFHSELSVAETAELMGRSELAVRQLQHRAARKLAELLAEERFESERSGA
jgi:RNA polymerase sigma-70 factor (ECF subfamily)